MGKETKKAQAMFLNVGEACSLLDQSEEIQVQQEGGMSLHWLRHDTRGEVLMVQGSNGEFALIQGI